MGRRRVCEEVELDLASGTVDPADNPEAALGRKDMGRVLRECLNALPACQAEVSGAAVVAAFVAEGLDSPEPFAATAGPPAARDR